MRRPALSIDGARLKALLDGINAFGRNPAGGFDRPAFSDADMAVRRWFADEMAADGLAVHWDGAGNVVGRYGARAGPCVMLGSHLDTVPSGGAYDGSLGCAVALEAVRTLREAGGQPSVAVEVIATADEEGRFGGMLGSQALVGAAKPEWVASARDADGVPLADAMRAQGLDPHAIGDARREPGEVLAFLELHIEQGPVLEEAGETVGLVAAISGVCVLQVSLTGVANHSGTTPMDRRADALVGLANVAARLPEVALSHGPTARLTIGHVELEPNAMHTIPSLARFTIVLRDDTLAAMSAVRDDVEALLRRTARRFRLGLKVRELSSLDPVTLDRGLLERLRLEADRLGLASRVMVSGAGHDAQTMAALCPSALVFVPSTGGISHAPAEHTPWSAIEAGANLLANTLASLVR